MYEFYKILKNGNAKHLFFPGATSQQLLQYLDVNLQLYGPQTVIIHVGINDLLNDPGHSNVENILKNFRAMVKKCREFNVKNILLSGLVYKKRTELSLLENLHLRIVELCSQDGIMYVDNRNIYGMHLYHDKLHLLPEKVILGNLNINSLPNKFEQLKETVLKYVDVLVLTETKLDDSFPQAQFLVEGFSEPYRYDRNRKGGGVMIYIRDDIPSKCFENINFQVI